jgi:hypothetical protein
MAPIVVSRQQPTPALVFGIEQKRTSSMTASTDSGSEGRRAQEHEQVRLMFLGRGYEFTSSRELAGVVEMLRRLKERGDHRAILDFLTQDAGQARLWPHPAAGADEERWWTVEVLGSTGDLRAAAELLTGADSPERLTALVAHLAELLRLFMIPPDYRLGLPGDVTFDYAWEGRDGRLYIPNPDRPAGQPGSFVAGVWVHGSVGQVILQFSPPVIGSTGLRIEVDAVLRSGSQP